MKIFAELRRSDGPFMEAHWPDGTTRLTEIPALGWCADKGAAATCTAREKDVKSQPASHAKHPPVCKRPATKTDVRAHQASTPQPLATDLSDVFAADDPAAPANPIVKIFTQLPAEISAQTMITSGVKIKSTLAKDQSYIQHQTDGRWQLIVAVSARQHGQHRRIVTALVEHIRETGTVPSKDLALEWRALLLNVA